MQESKEYVEEVTGGLEIDEHLYLHKKGWIIQRVGWAIIVAIMIAGLLGLFGGGLISKKKASSKNFTAEYESIYRYETEMKVLVEASEHISSISFDQQYLKGFRIVRFVPEPFSNNTLSNQVRYNFLGGANKIVSIYLIPTDYGVIKGSLKVNSLSEIKLSHFIFP